MKPVVLLEREQKGLESSLPPARRTELKFSSAILQKELGCKKGNKKPDSKRLW